MTDTDEMLSVEALKWLKSVDYSKRTHEERIILLQTARILYPN